VQKHITSVGKIEYRLGRTKFFSLSKKRRGSKVS